MSRTRPFTRYNTRPLIRVCDVVRNGLGLSALSAEYLFPHKQAKDDCTYAWAKVYYSGWRCHIEFMPLYFKQSLQRQLEIIVHEHIHVLMHPLDQIVYRCEENWCRPADRNKFNDAAQVAREVTVDHAMQPIYTLLEPQIRAVL